MSDSIFRRGALLSATLAALLLGTLVAASSSPAATLYACINQNHGTHVFVHKHKCKKGESKLTWNTSGQNGKSGANGVNGANGAPGQPQSIKVFSATVPREGPAVTLFSADGITYTFVCLPFFGINIGRVEAAGAAGQSFGSAVIRRPSGQEQEKEDLTVFAETESLGGEAKPIATTADALENKAKQFEQLGVWTVSVQGPSSVTQFHLLMDITTGCSVRGNAFTVPIG